MMTPGQIYIQHTTLPAICIDETALDRMYNTRVRASDAKYLAWRANIGREQSGWWKLLLG